MCVKMLINAIIYMQINSMGGKNTLKSIATTIKDNKLLCASQRVLLI